MAGLLGDIFSAGNVAKRKLTDLLGNPILSAQQILGNLNDRARVLNEMTAAAAREGVSYGPSSQQLAGLLSEAYNPVGLTVFHGSPAKFQKFDPTKIGSGEGAQAYGYGHYVAESPGVAESYRKALSDNVFTVGGKDIAGPTSKYGQPAQNPSRASLSTPEKIATYALDSAIKNGSSDPAVDAIKHLTKYGKGNPDVASALELVRQWSQQGGKIESGNLYKIDLPDEQIAKMLDYDKPIKDQPEVLKAIRNQIQDEDIAKSFDINVKSGISGANAYQNYVYGKTPAEKAEILRQAGVPGIRYLDQGSRGTGQGTSNFVVFPGNEDLLRILERNNQPLSLLD